MSTKSTAREQILGRIRAALRDVPSNEQPQDVVVPLDYRRSETAPREEVVERFVERVAEYKVNVQRVDEASLPAAIAAACTARNVRHLVIPTDLPGQWLPGGVELLHDDNTLTNEQLDTSDGVLTGCALGIAQTGTIVLDDGPHQGRRAITLVPDYHLCVVYEEQIVGLVPEAIAGLRDAVLQHKRPITFISGPSATSDIELNRVEGVHGPRTLDVLVVGVPLSHTS
jgi:L-lactate dehydrogenase complex protein LldG